MEYFIFYKHKRNSEGTLYNQTIRLILNREEFRNLNEYIAITRLNNPKDYYIRTFVKTLQRGVNYTTLTSQELIINKLNIINDKRYLHNRNTIFIVEII